MKRVLVIGDDSYIGKSFEAFARDSFEIKMVNSMNNAWQSVDFTGYDSVLHCAGIAHVKQIRKMESLYYKVNCDLAVAVANKAKSSGVKQFVFLSSMAVYGTSRSEIDETTIPEPDPRDFYGCSKLKAEQELQKLADDKYKLCIVRPPMVYGKGCKGNFPRLCKLAKKTPIIPDYPNSRSMIFIDNLCYFLQNAMFSESRGFFLPQNSEYVNTTQLIKLIAAKYSKQIITTKVFNPFVKLMTKHITLFSKLFGDLIYMKSDNEYSVIDFDESIKMSLE